MMLVYSLMLSLATVVCAPWWVFGLLRGGRFRDGFWGRLGSGAGALRETVAGRRTVWVHAVSVGEVLAVARLVEELQAAMGPGWVIAVSTTTAAGQRIARAKLAPAGVPVFWFPLDFAFAVRAYLRALRPGLLVLVESELWPRMLEECRRAGVPVAVVNARVSDRSYRRTLRVRRLWVWMAARVSLWLAQGEETAGRLLALGVDSGRVRVLGNMKYDAGRPPGTMMAACVLAKSRGTQLVVAGSTLAGEEAMLLDTWEALRAEGLEMTLLLAPRHPERFGEVERLLEHRGLQMARASEGDFSRWARPGGGVLLLDTLGDLAGVYGAADVAFVGGSLVPAGGHNPLEAACFGVPVLMGQSYENFREVVEGLVAAGGMRVVGKDELPGALRGLLARDGGMGARGKAFYETQTGATGRTVVALLALLGESRE